MVLLIAVSISQRLMTEVMGHVKAVQITVKNKLWRVMSSWSLISMPWGSVFQNCCFD